MFLAAIAYVLPARYGARYEDYLTSVDKICQYVALYIKGLWKSI